jgi:hypothetical protein
VGKGWGKDGETLGKDGQRTGRRSKLKINVENLFNVKFLFEIIEENAKFLFEIIISYLRLWERTGKCRKRIRKGRGNVGKGWGKDGKGSKLKINVEIHLNVKVLFENV